MTKTEEDKMKQWKLVLVALLAVLLVCTCTSALAECKHTNTVLVKNGTYKWTVQDATYHVLVENQDRVCTDCGTIVLANAATVETPSAHGTLQRVVVEKNSCTSAGSYYDKCTVCSYKTATFTIGKLDHDYTYVAVPATCTVAKHYHYTCKNCGLEYDGDFSGDALGHSPVATWTKENTCTQEGEVVTACQRCGLVIKTEAVAKKDHSPVAEWIAKPTCSTEGSVKHYCQNCGEVFKIEAVATTPHTPVTEFSIVPTCTTKGEEVTYCKVCGEEFERKVVGVIPHTYKGTTVPSTCTEEGSYTVACTVCGEVDKKASYPLALADHTWKKVNAKTAYCGEDGHKAYFTCTACGTLTNESGNPIKAIEVVKMPAAEHDWYAGEKKEATCLEGGYVKYLCHFCTKINKVETEKLAHEYNPNGWKTIKAATCFETGLKTNSCILCGGAEKEEIIPVAGHKFATGEELKYNGVGDIAGGKGQVTKAATCTKEGAATVICQTCNKTTQNIVIPAHGHIWGNWEYSGQPSCTADATATRVCKSCGTVETKVIAEKLGHAWIIKAGTDATCTTDGKVDRFCPLCNTTEKNVKVPATGHNLVWTTVAQPTAAADGLKELACTVCGYVAESKVIPYTVMRYSNTATAFGPTTRELVGGSEWARVTPIDLSVEGTFTYPLIASNQYVIGTVTVTIANGTATVNYDTAASQIKVTDEALYLYADKAALAAGTAQEYAFGAPIQIGEDTNVILSVLLTVDYDAVGAGVTGFAADEAQIEAMKAIID